MGKKRSSGFKKKSQNEVYENKLNVVPYLLFLLGFTFFFYSSSLTCGFVFDDFNLVKNNPFLRGIKSVSYLFSHFFSVYRPIRTLSYLLDAKIGGMDPLYFHLFNVLYHLLAVFLIYRLLLLLFGERRYSLLATSIFALHPIHVDAVTYISGRRDVLSSIFVILSLIFFIKYKKTQKFYWWIFIFISIFLGIFTKEMAFSAPLLIFLVDFFFFNGEVKRSSLLKMFFKTLRRGILYYSIFLLGGIFYLYKIIFHTSISGRTHYWGGNFLTNVLTVSKVFVYYIYLLFFPFNLRGDYYYYTFPISFSPGDVLGWGALLLIMVLIYLAYYFYKRGNVKLSFLISFFFISLLPVSHIIPHHELMAEHYLYLPSLSFALFLSYLYERYYKRWFLYLFILLLIVYGVKVYHHSLNYRDQMTFLNYNIKKSPECVRLNMALGNDYYLNKDYVKAKRYYERVLELGPIEDREGVKISFSVKKVWGRDISNKDFGYFVLAARRLADIYSKEGKYKKAIEVLKGAIRYGLIVDTIYNEIGNNYAFMGDIKKAIEYFKESVKINPKNFWSLNNLGVSYSRLGKYDEALKWFKKALLVKGDDTYTNYNVGLILILKGDRENGILYLNRALKFKGLSDEDRKRALEILNKYKNSLKK